MHAGARGSKQREMTRAPLIGGFDFLARDVESCGAPRCTGEGRLPLHLLSWRWRWRWPWREEHRDALRLYFLLEPSLGGELFTILREEVNFNHPTARFYAAGIGQ